MIDIYVNNEKFQVAPGQLITANLIREFAKVTATTSTWLVTSDGDILITDDGGVIVDDGARFVTGEEK
jgi:hypothetical protein